MKAQCSAAANAMRHYLYDSHCHLRVRSANTVETAAVCAAASPSASPSVMEGCTPPAVAGLVLCGTHPHVDWGTVSSAACRLPSTRLLFGFGLHPWFVPSTDPTTGRDEGESVSTTDPAASQGERGVGCCSMTEPVSASLQARRTLSLPDILAELEVCLTAHPRAIVAEIGLDKLKGPAEETQRAAFVAQLRLAAAHERPVSVHCVRHYGLLLSVLQELTAEDTPPAIIVHAFTGSHEVAKSLLSLKNKKRVAQSKGSADTEPQTDGALTGKPKKRSKRGGGGGAAAVADVVRISERIFFGVGISTSFTVKSFAAQTLPPLLCAQRLLVETDAHYSGEAGRGSRCDDAHFSASESRVCVAEEEHAQQLRGVVAAVAAAAAQSDVVVKAAETAGVSTEAFVGSSLAAAFETAFHCVLH